MIHFDEHIACTYFSKWVGSTTTYTTMGTQNLFFIMILGSKGTDRQDIGRSPLFVGDCWGKDYYRAPECYIPSSQTCPGLRVQDWRGKHVGGKHLIEAVDVLMNLRHISRFPCVDCGLLSVALCFWIKYLFWMWYIYIHIIHIELTSLPCCYYATGQRWKMVVFILSCFFFWILSCHIKTPLPKVTPKSSRTQTCPTNGDSWDWYTMVYVYVTFTCIYHINQLFM